MKCFEKCGSVKFTAKKEACYLMVASFFDTKIHVNDCIYSFLENSPLRD